MKKTFIPLLAAALLGTAATSAQANSVECNVSIALKFYYNESDSLQPVGKFRVKNYKVLTIKNANIIASIKAANPDNAEFDFPPNAKIIRKTYFNSDGGTDATVYLLRDKSGKEKDITNCLDVDYLSRVEKAKLAEATGTGTINWVATDLFQFSSKPGSEGFDAADGAGISRYNAKVVQVKGTTDLVAMLGYSSKVGGSGAFEITDFVEGVIEGSIKISGAKIISAALPAAD